MTENRRALIIASYEYQDPNLRQLVTPAQDADDLALVLRDPAIGGFDKVETSINQPSHDVRRAVASFFAQGARKDLLLLYFSGHGLLDVQGHLYLAAQDTERDLLSATAIPAVFVSAEMDRNRSRRQVLVLDCCHSGAFDRGTKGAIGARVGTSTAFEGTGYGRVVLTATDSTQYAWEGDQVTGQAEHSVFTHYLVHGLQTGEADTDADGLITLDELYDYVYAQVVRETPRQTPGKWAYKQQGDILIARNPHLTVKPVPLPPDLQQAIESSTVWMREGAVSGLERLLHGSDESLALEARKALTLLAKDDSRRVFAAAARALGVVVEPVSVPMSPVEVERPELAPNTLTITSPIHLELVRVPAGEFLMGSDPARDEFAQDYEQPQHSVHLSEFYIAKYPVTNEQYKVFARAVDHILPKHWENGNIPSDKENHPVVWVSWDDALAFCEWLSREADRNFRLPTEAEWEKAARGTDGRIYPWGSDPPTPELCNFDKKGYDTMPVDQYSPQGNSPYGCADMAGNVWEWTLSLWGKGFAIPDFGYPYNPDDGREDVSASERIYRIWRGGAMHTPYTQVRCASRSKFNPGFQDGYLGFRVALVLFE